MSEKSCVENGTLFYFNDYGKLELFYMQQKYFLLKQSSVLFIECAELNWNRKNAYGLRVYIFLKDTGWYLGVIQKLHDNEFLIYIFISRVLYGTCKWFIRII